MALDPMDPAPSLNPMSQYMFFYMGTREEQKCCSHKQCTTDTPTHNHFSEHYATEKKFLTKLFPQLAGSPKK